MTFVKNDEILACECAWARHKIEENLIQTASDVVDTLNSLTKAYEKAGRDYGVSKWMYDFYKETQALIINAI